ncbi:MAG: host-nuclease inhibitor Gam family protein [Verrucomicrobiota bacterium]|nr:host-nuclease inhibitor Gam family protein [Verrucomicrobiota bacterium]
MTTRLKSKSTGLTSSIEFRSTIDQIATLQLRANLLIARRDKKIQAIREEADGEIGATQAERDRLLLLAESYASAHRDELLPTDRKSVETPLAIFGFRIGNPTLKTLNSRWTWERVKERCQELKLTQFLVQKETLDKDRIKTDLTTDAALANIGCRIEQAESFFIEPKDDGAKEVA